MSPDFRSTLSTLYAKEGVAGLYRGLIPRTIHMVPAYMAWIYYNQSFKPTDRISEFYTTTDTAWKSKQIQTLKLIFKPKKK